MKEVYIAVLGTGVPKDILSDGNYNRFLNVVRNDLFEFQARKVHCIVYLCGGPTNPNFLDRTEAGEMKRWFSNRIPKGWASDVEFVLIDTTMDATENIEALGTILGKKNPHDVRIFVEYARQDTTWILARRFLNLFTIVPIKYDVGKNAYVERIKRIPKVLLMLGALRSGMLRSLQIKLRHNFIQRWGKNTQHRP